MRLLLHVRGANVAGFPVFLINFARRGLRTARLQRRYATLRAAGGPFRESALRVSKKLIVFTP